MVTGIIAILISLGSLVFSIITFKKALKMKRIEHFFKHGTPEEIDLNIEHLKQDLHEHIEKIKHRYYNTRIEARRELAKRNLAGDMTTEMMLKIEKEEKQKINRAHKIINRKIELLELKKSQIEKL